MTLKPINFNPLSFISFKYPPKTLMMMDRNKIKLDGNFGKTKNSNTFLNDLNKDSKENMRSTNTKKIKVNSLEKSKSCSYLFQRSDNYCFPSVKISQDIVKYNMSNKHNTILNYYHKNPRNLRIINFVRTNSFNQNNISNSMNKNISLNKSSCNNSGQISKNENSHINTKSDIGNSSLNINIKNNINYPNISFIPQEDNFSSKINTKKNKKTKTKLTDYELEMVGEKYPHNLRFFSSQLFGEDKNKKKKKTSKKISNICINNEENKKNILEIKNNSNLKNQLIEFKDKNKLVDTNLTNEIRIPTLNKKDEILHIEKNEKMNPLEGNNLDEKIPQLILNPNTGKLRDNIIGKRNKIKYSNKNMSYADLREISKKGFKRMQNDKFRRFNLLVENTNKEVLQLEKKLDKLLEINKNIFLEEKEY